MVNIISIDVANKSLATSIIFYNLNVSNDMIALYTSYKNKKKVLLDNLNDANKNQIINSVLLCYTELLSNIITLNSEKIKVLYLDVIDLIPGKKLAETSAIYRTDKLHTYLHNTLDPLIPADCIFLLEKQMGPNVKSNVIESQLMYHFIKYQNECKTNVQLIGSSLKNKINVGSGADSHHATFIEKYATNYAANKAHSTFNTIKFLTYLNSLHMLSDIKKKNYDDISDSVMQSLAYVLYNYGF